MLEESNTVRPIVMVLANPGIGKPSLLNFAEVDLVPSARQSDSKLFSMCHQTCCVVLRLSAQDKVLPESEYLVSY